MALQDRLNEIRKKVLKPQPKLTVVEWADTFRFLSPESSSVPGRWKTSTVEVSRGPLMAVTEKGIKKITVMSPTQLLKALALDTKLPTPTGWTTMGECKVGDKLFDENGRPCTIVGKSEVVTNPTVEITFSDGQKVVCDYGHRWFVHDYTNPDNIKEKVLTSEEILKTYKMHQNRNRYAIPISKTLELTENVLYIHPYVLGYWLGNGHSYSSRITLSINDFKNIESNFNRFGYKLIRSNSKNPNVVECRVHDQNGSIHSHLNKYNLLQNKHIPEIYLRSNKEQRQFLLNGLLDSDGTVDTNGKVVSITQKVQRLSDNIKELMLGLGFKCNQKQITVNYKGEQRPYHLITLTAYPGYNLFLLERKQQRVLEKKVKYNRLSDSMYRRIVSVVPSGSVEVQCLSVDSPNHLFLCTESFIPTHNTEAINNIVGYFIHQDPAPMIVMQPTTKLGESWSKDRLDKMLRDTPVLQDTVGSKRGRESENTILHKVFPGGHITIVGSNSPSDLASRPVRITLCDEVDKYPPSAGKEGDPLTLIEERTSTFWNSLNVRVCSPTVTGSSRIEEEFLAGDQRYFHAKCPDCESLERLKFENIIYDEKDIKNTTYYVCSNCAVQWDDNKRLEAVSKGQYIASKPFDGHASFHCNRIASPWNPLWVLIDKYMKSKDSPELLKVFINTQLAETWQEQGEVPDYMRLYSRRETYKPNTVNTNVVFLTAGVDIQKDRAELEIVGWAKDKQSWSIDYRVIPGDPYGEELWKKLDEILAESWKRDDGKHLRLEMMVVDSGYATQAVYNWVHSKKFERNRVRVGDGQHHLKLPFGKPSNMDLNYKGKALKNSVLLWPIGVSTLKAELYGWLELNPGTEKQDNPKGYCHYPEYDSDFFQGLCSEQLIKKIVNRREVYHWVKLYNRNEPLDCRIYARAAAAMFGLDRFSEQDWVVIEQMLGDFEPVEYIREGNSQDSDDHDSSESDMWSDKRDRDRGSKKLW